MRSQFTCAPVGCSYYHCSVVPCVPTGRSRGSRASRPGWEVPRKASCVSMCHLLWDWAEGGFDWSPLCCNTRIPVLSEGKIFPLSHLETSSACPAITPGCSLTAEPSMYTRHQAHSELLVTATQSCRKPEQSEMLCPRREHPKIRGGVKDSVQSISIRRSQTPCTG